MIVDSSALLAILLREPERQRFIERIAIVAQPVLSPVNYVEAAIGADRLGQAESRGLDGIVEEFGIEIAPVTATQARLARAAYEAFGTGRHAARLNLGDCFAYALAKARSEPLLFKGDDFRLTDVEPAL